MGMEAQEDLGSGENLLTDLEPQPDPFSADEPCSVALASASAEASSDSGFADVAVEAVEHLMAKPLSEEEIQAMGGCEMEQTEVPAKKDDECCKTDDPVQQDDDPIKGEALAIEEIKAERSEPVQAEVPPVPAGAFPESSNPVDEPEAREAVAEVPDDAIPSLESETEKSPPLPALLTAESLASTETASNEVEPVAESSNEVAGSAASVEDSTIAKSAEVKEAIIDPGIAVATIPEMPPLVPVTDETQAAVDESNESVVMPSESALQAEASGPAETTSLKEPALVLDVPVSSTLLLETSSKEESEAASAFGASPSTVTSDCTVQVHAAEATQAEIADQASESSTEVMSAAECHQGMEKDRAKKEE
ncbi:fibrous sheath CABYR-binding protein-like [Syngnathus typhle]|uniref:fibrous sheath CABYR-binding protein-like n=1 Tax=Syngnathus typhle TaxID=161592 RepID=UPI002A6B8D60|nr:fibrous sheath CABYR-binding protein-like [Syngnathus typhle]